MTCITQYEKHSFHDGVDFELERAAVSQDSIEAVGARLLAALPTLAPQLAQGARFLLDHPEVVATTSMRDIAGRVGVAPATLLRLARALGFTDWSSMRDVYVANFRTTSPLYAERADALVRREGVPALAEDMLRAQQAGISQVIAVNRAEAIDDAARILAAAPRIFVAAFLSCRAPGTAFAYICRLFRSNIVLLGGEGSSLAADLAAIGPEDAVLAINFRPYAREIHAIAETVQQSGAALVSIADSRASPLAAQARPILLFSTESPSFFPSITPAMALVESLAAAMLAHAGDAAAARIGTIEHRLYESGAYAAAPPRRR